MYIDFKVWLALKKIHDCKQPSIILGDFKIIPQNPMEWLIIFLKPTVMRWKEKIVKR